MNGDFKAKVCTLLHLIYIIYMHPRVRLKCVSVCVSGVICSALTMIHHNTDNSLINTYGNSL